MIETQGVEEVKEIEVEVEVEEKETARELKKRMKEWKN